MAKKQEIKREMVRDQLSSSEFDRYDLEGNVESAIAAIKRAVETIPEEFRASACISFDVGIMYDSPFADITMSYMRPESDVELEARRKRFEQFQTSKEETERREYERLEKIYGKKAGKAP